VKRPAVLLACLATVCLVVSVGASQATVSSVTLTVTESSATEFASGSTLYYAPTAATGAFTVTAAAVTSSSLTSVDFPAITGMTGGGSVAAPGPYDGVYSWASAITTTGAQTVTVNDSDPSSTDADFTVTPDTAPTVIDTAPTEITGAADQYWVAATDTLWFRPAGAGSFTLNATADNATGSGIAQVAFPDISAVSGWAGSTGGADQATSYASPVAYAWTAGATAPGAKQVTATNNTGLTGTDTVTISADSTAPTGQTVALSGGPWYSTASVPLTLGNGTDPGAGVDASRGIVERASAPLTNSVCGTFGAFAAVTLSGGADTSVASANCYRYQYKATDNVGNVSTASAASADAKVDTTAPTTPNLLLTGFTNTASVGNVVYYRPAGSGRFTVTAASADSESGVASYNFPSIAGFTVLGSGPSRTFSFSDAPSAAPAAVTVTATNGAGLTSPGASFTLVPDPTPPTVTVRCNGKPCLTTTYAKAVAVTLSATDGAGSGVDTIRYTTNGTDPKVDGGIEYTRAFSVRSLARLRVRAYDKAGNASNAVVLAIRSAADRLVFSAPPRLVVKSRARYLFARVASTRRAVASATMTGPNLKTPHRWRFILGSGRTIVQLRLPARLAHTGRYRIVWTVKAGTQKTSKTTLVTLGRPRA
jgi:hypothetical protein